MKPQFIQIHTLTAYPAALLNRDDAGFSKRLPLGGAARTRISSQCLKRHWRTFEGEHSLNLLEGGAPTIRSRLVFEEKIVRPLVEDEKLPADLVRAVAQEVQDIVLGARKEEAGEKGKGKGKKAVAEVAAPLTKVKTEQVIVVGQPEIDYLKSVCQDICKKITQTAQVPAAVEAHLKDRKELRENLAKIRLHAGIGAAMFGRMVTSDILSRGDAAVHVAHAFTVHREEAETDYFSAIDDLAREEGELGSGHIGNTELTSGLYYGYVVIDVPLLISNLNDDPRLAGQVVSSLLRLISTVSPGAKLGSTAPYAWAKGMLVETGSSQPRTLANAFLRPVRLDTQGGVLQGAFEAMARHVRGIDEMYGKSTTRQFKGLEATPDIYELLSAEESNVPQMAEWAGRYVAGTL